MKQAALSEMLKLYRGPLVKKVCALAAPLKDCFGIDEFNYSYLNTEGNFYSVSNQPEMAEFFFSQEVFKHSSLFRHPDNFKSSILMPTTIPDEDKVEEVMRPQFGFAAENLFCILRREKEVLHKFLFNIKTPPKDIISFYANHLSFLDAFCTHFLKEWSHHLDVLEKHSLFLPDFVGHNFFAVENSLEKNSDIENKERFLKEIGLLPAEFILPSRIPKQEMQVLGWLLKGKSSNQIAQEMNLSKRTVEHYLTNVKNRLGCWSKGELCEIATALEMLGLI